MLLKIPGNSDDMLLHDGIVLAADAPGVIRDENGVPIEWPLLRIGDNPIVKNGVPGSLNLSDDDMQSILGYHSRKGELIPVDSNHYLHELATRKKLDEAEVLKLLPSGVAAMGFGSLALSGDELRFRVKWTPTAYELMKEKIFQYYSPALRGIVNPPLRLTSVAMENEPAINNLDALAASARKLESAILAGGSTPKAHGLPESGRGNPQGCHCSTKAPEKYPQLSAVPKGPRPVAEGRQLFGDANRGRAPHNRKGSAMTKLEKALAGLLGRDSLALEGEGDDIATAVEAKGDLLAEFRKSLNLGDDIDDKTLVVALKSIVEKAGGADKLAGELEKLKGTVDGMAASANRKAHDDLIAQGEREGKIVPATKEWWEKLDSTQLSAYLPQAPVVAPPAKINRDDLTPPDEVALTAEDRETCKRFGFTEEEFLKTKKGL